MRGVDVSQYALDHAAFGARGHVRYGNLLHRLPFGRGAFEGVSLFETLEHLPPEVVPRALREVRRMTTKYVIATIPSFGPNPNGPGGWFDVKVRPERLDHYRSLGDEYDGPVAYDDLYRDDDGAPIEGHLTIASFAWWTRQFEAGFVRDGAVERRIHPHLARLGLTKYWNLYVFGVAVHPPRTTSSARPRRSPTSRSDSASINGSPTPKISLGCRRHSVPRHREHEPGRPVASAARAGRAPRVAGARA